MRQDVSSPSYDFVRFSKKALKLIDCLLQCKGNLLKKETLDEAKEVVRWIDRGAGKIEGRRELLEELSCVKRALEPFQPQRTQASSMHAESRCAYNPRPPAMPLSPKLLPHNQAPRETKKVSEKIEIDGM